MLIRCCWIACVCLCLLTDTIAASEKINVLVLPFEINSIEQRDYLQLEIKKVIESHLGQQGATIVELPPAMAGTDPTGNVRALGLSSGADYVVWGSLTLIEPQFSLDARLTHLFENRKRHVFTAEGRGLENLAERVKQIALDIGLKLFERVQIADIQVEGNQRIEADAILRVVQSDVGDVYSAKTLSDDLKAVYAMGYFDDVRVEAEDVPGGRRVIFRIKEKPTIRRIRIADNKVYDDEEIMENLTIKTGSILNIFQIQNNIKLIEDLYKEKNYHNVDVDYKVTEQENNQGDLEFIITEGSKLRIKHIRFEGNETFSEKKLKKQIDTKEKGFFFWLTESGELKQEKLDQDSEKLNAFYHNNGFIRARVSEPIIEFKAEWIEVTFKISEGDRFRVGSVDVAGDLIFPKEQLLQKLDIGQEEYYNRTILQQDILKLTDLYADQGYAYADISPDIDENKAQKTVDITFRINRGEQVYFEAINITGNSKTRDKVIRRQLKVIEQELYSGTDLRNSIQRLYRLDYFADIKVDTVRGSDNDKMILNIDVEEKSTGTFSFGGGYSNIEELFLTASINQRNLFGRGQTLMLKGTLGAESNIYSLSFTEPWLFDIPLSATARLYNWVLDRDSYEKDSFGGGLSFGYPVFRDTRLTLGADHDTAKLKNVDADAPESIKDLEEQFGSDNIITNSVNATLKYDTLNRRFLPSRGASHRVAVEYAGLGGDVGYTKYIGEVGWYFPLLWQLVGHLHAKGGYVVENPDGVLPDYELFFLGGITSIRGWDRDDLSPEDEEGNDIGGDRFVQFNAEMIFPIIAGAGIHGVVFYDAGDLANGEALRSEDRQIDFNNLAMSTGIGVRWNSPVGPIRIEYGWVIDPAPGQEPGDWEFALGAAF